jgi:hypothetical protein
LVELKSGMKIRFHGGWDGKKERCTVCKWQCSYIYSGEIIERYQVWDVKSQKFVLSADDLWTARIETGSYAVGYPEQFEEVV